MRKHFKVSAVSAGFTLVEITVSVFLGTMVMLGAMQLVSTIRNYFITGSVNLSNLQEARTALAYLRRDFSSACPNIVSSDTALVQELTKANPFKLDAGALQQSSYPIHIIDRKKLSFFRFLYDSVPGKAAPTIEAVEYEHDPATRVLTRNSGGKTTQFKGIKEVYFGLYVHPANPEVPFLQVKIKVFDEQFARGATNVKALAINTSMAAPFVTSLLNNPSWNYTTLTN